MPVPASARDWLTLLHTPGLGDRRLARLLDEHGSPPAVLAAGETAWKQANVPAAALRALADPDQAAIDTSLAWLEAAHHFLITRDEDGYPPLLREIPDPPPALFVSGDPGALYAPQIAIVGSRSATPGGLDCARDFAANLARAGMTVTSGLAVGIDGAAHSACLKAGGKTIAVAGTGPDRVYPARHRALARDIVAGGALVSSFPPGTDVRPAHFPMRNRIISGMSLGTLVVEAGLESGSLITARMAVDQGREVFAVPGSIHNPVARGCHRLIRQGARLVESAGEIVEALAPLAEQLAGSLHALMDENTTPEVEPDGEMPHIAHDPDYRRLLEAIGHDPTQVDVIIERSKLTTGAVSSMLLMLELKGLVSAHPGGRYSRTRTS